MIYLIMIQMYLQSPAKFLIFFLYVSTTLTRRIRGLLVKNLSGRRRQVCGSRLEFFLALDWSSFSPSLGLYILFCHSKITVLKL